MYMNNPLCLPVNSNPEGVWPPQEFQSQDDQLFAAQITTLMLDFKDTLDRYESRQKVVFGVSFTLLTVLKFSLMFSCGIQFQPHA